MKKQFKKKKKDYYRLNVLVCVYVCVCMLTGTKGLLEGVSSYFFAVYVQSI